MTPVFDAVLTQLRLLTEARTRPDVELHAVETNALHFILLALKAEADLPTQQAIDGYLKGGAKAHTYLPELAHGWRCPACNSRVPGRAAIAAASLFIICKACDTKSPATEQGSAALNRHFPVGPAWNPQDNGFEK